jgi:type II secretory ATPase GspE/PulE/Tfp pilus assembly ATPase PilB-like protein
VSQDARIDEEQATQRRAQILNLNYRNTADPDKQLYKDLLSKEELYKLKSIPVIADAHNILFGVTNTTSQATMTDLRHRFTDHQVVFALISDTGFRDYMKLYDPPKKVEYQEISLSQQGSAPDISQVSASLLQVRADDLLAYLVQQAHRLGASDIHLEPQKQGVRIRFRVDGVLHKVAELVPDKYRILISAIASASNVSTSSEEAQQGHISQKAKLADGSEISVNVRVETVQGVNGIEVVMRLFNMDQSMYNLDRLGLSPSERAIVDDIIAKPSGLVLVVGPTGSGKTTTLYSMLNTLNNEERKTITIEDPVEYHFEGISQLSVKTRDAKSTSFAEKLRAILRLDPDIVMVGEIRDNDTAKTSLQAALTGHLVLSTFHASSAAAALTRLTDVIGENPLFVSAIRLVMAQRLVRSLDNKTKQGYPADDAHKRKIQQIIDTLPPGVERPDISNLQLFNPVASAENPYGFSGQIALREQFVMKGKVAEVMTNGTGLTAQQIEEAAVESGMKTMLQDGILKVVAGETTLEEIFRVVG